MPGIRMIPYLQEGCRYHTRLPKYEIRRVKWGVTDIKLKLKMLKNY